MRGPAQLCFMVPTHVSRIMDKISSLVETGACPSICRPPIWLLLCLKGDSIVAWYMSHEVLFGLLFRHMIRKNEEIFSHTTTTVRRVVDITAIHGVPRPLIHVRTVRRKGCVVESNPSPHGGRGALPSEGGSPSDLLFLAGGGSASSLFSFCVY
ncbi:hypothetical protein Pyn_02918 [Prunus yedoensis var. nudiflora]|uniref:Uncharacterized protein n=1 Tax=Prunus yedoensis var. nudiflora TaxID=2094558 RepID=A0A314UNT3_PRUYE|nr:hypothetical protein Pyn_02918 [Prunus yedoensis var. nudiflora]